MSQPQDGQSLPLAKLLQQVHPSPLSRPPDIHRPPPSATEAHDGPDAGPALQVSAQGPDYWEGHCRLNDGKTVPFQAHRMGQQVHLWIGGESFVFSPVVSASRGRRSQQTSTDEIFCSMPGVVIAIHVAEGDTVEAGQDLLVLESMKTEQVVKSPRDGTIQRLPVQPGDRVDRGMRLVVLVPLEAE